MKAVGDAKLIVNGTKQNGVRKVAVQLDPNGLKGLSKDDTPTVRPAPKSSGAAGHSRTQETPCHAVKLLDSAGPAGWGSVFAADEPPAPPPEVQLSGPKEIDFSSLPTLSSGRYRLYVQCEAGTDSYSQVYKSTPV